MAHRPLRPWSTRWKTGPANAVPMRLTTKDVPIASPARNRTGRTAPAPPITATEA